jgi:vacuolar-type H+-ATPase subunit E/Vma4
MMQTLGSPASVVAAIREEANAEVERMEEATAAELAVIRAQSASAGVAIADREERLAAARRTEEERVAKQEWQGRRAAIEQREQWIQRVVGSAQERWTGGDASKRHVALHALVREARSRLPHGPCEVAVRDGDVVDIPDARVTAAPIAGGCIITAGDVSFDNSFEARSRRLEPEWRSALSGMYKP